MYSAEHPPSVPNGNVQSQYFLEVRCFVFLSFFFHLVSVAPRFRKPTCLLHSVSEGTISDAFGLAATGWTSLSQNTWNVQRRPHFLGGGCKQRAKSMSWCTAHVHLLEENELPYGVWPRDNDHICRGNQTCVTDVSRVELVEWTCRNQSLWRHLTR